MASESDIQHLTEFEQNDDIEELADRTPDDAVEFDLYYDGRVVNQWSKGPNELVRLYFNDDEQDDRHVPIDFAEKTEDGVRSTPSGGRCATTTVMKVATNRSPGTTSTASSGSNRTRR